MRFCVVNLGCKVNRVESDDFERRLHAAGATSAPAEAADLIVVNTCTVTGEAEKKTRKAVRRALRASERAQVVVTGCAAAIDAAAFEAMDARVQVVPKASMAAWISERTTLSADDSAGEVPPVFDASLASPQSRSHAAAGNDAAETDAANVRELGAPSSSRTRVGVKVQDGCDNACTFCIVHVARGRAQSRVVAEVVDECVSLARAGVREIVLTGINLGSYRYGDVGLAGLLERLLAETESLHTPGEPPCRFRVSSIEPMDVDDDFIEVLANADGRVCRHLHLPLQSGSDKVLREMARPYDTLEFCQLVDRLRARVEGLSLTTDIIVGFPGETDDDFQETLDAAWRCRFSKIHVFPYSRRKGTPAAARTDQVSAQVKSARASVLRQLSDELRAGDRQRRAGTREWALVQDDGCAMTESYHEIAAPEGARTGALVLVAL